MLAGRKARALSAGDECAKPPGRLATLATVPSAGGGRKGQYLHEAGLVPVQEGLPASPVAEDGGDLRLALLQVVMPKPARLRNSD